MHFMPAHIASLVYRLLFGTLVLALATIASADDLIRVKNITGTVQVRAGVDDTWKKVASDIAVSAPVEFRTLSDGTGILMQSGSEFELKSDSHITLETSSAGSSDGLVTKIKQWFGTVFYRIERQPDEFSVETPFLVSTVKGTRFVIVSTQSSSMVTLTEGSLEVLDIATGKIQMLDPGDIAGVGTEQAGIQSFKQAPAYKNNTPTPESNAPSVGINNPSDSFENALAAIAEVTSEEAFAETDDATSGDDGSSSGNDSGTGTVNPGPGGDDGAGGSGGDGSGDDGGGHDHSHDNGNHHGHDHGDHDDGDDDDDD